MKRFAMSLTVLASAAVLAACSSGVKLDENAGKTASVVNNAGAGTGTSRPVAPVTVATPDPLNDPSGVLAKRSVYFDFDSFAIRDDGRPVVENHSRYLATNKDRKVVLQGNTDDRGSREYNLALGQKRAEAVRKAMLSLGVADTQLEAVSFGEEKPKASNDDETGRAENRRVDLAY
ncbi:MAG: peptidoglycan-associated lipoprotein Pal [Burkholderiaceae bacterium]